MKKIKSEICSQIRIMFGGWDAALTTLAILAPALLFADADSEGKKVGGIIAKFAKPVLWYIIGPITIIVAIISSVGKFSHKDEDAMATAVKFLLGILLIYATPIIIRMVAGASDQAAAPGW